MQKLTVIIPVYNQFELVKKCVESVLRNTPEDVEIVIIDDASTCPKTGSYLNFLARGARARVWYQGTNRGFGSTVNWGMFECYQDSDVIVLNSDTEVPPGWIDRLRMCVDESTAAVCPVSNYATIYSVPNPGTNVLPAWLSTDQMDALVQAHSDHRHPEIPTVMGFCMYLTRKAIDAIGGFDAAFGKGYGEEVDWCLRARKAGFTCKLADDLFVRHKGQASFGENEERDELRRSAIRIVEERWPDYADEVRAWYLGAPLTALRVRLTRALRPRVGTHERPMVVHVAHNYGGPGGVETAIRRKALADEGTVEHVVIYPRFHGVAESACEYDADGVLRILASLELVNAPMTLGGHAFGCDPEESRVFAWFEQVLDALDPPEGSSVVFQHFAGWGHPDDCAAMVDVAREYFDLCSIFVVAHDVYWKCPRLFKGGACTLDHCGRTCLECAKEVIECKRPVHDERIGFALWDWSASWGDFKLRLRGVRLCAPSAAHAKRLGIEAEIEAPPVPTLPRVGVRGLSRLQPRSSVVFVGAATISKGWDAFASAARREPDRYDWHVLGPVDPECSRAGLEHVTFHGLYVAEELGLWLDRFTVAVPAVARTESYGLVVDECRQVLPVVVPDLPVLRERIPSTALVGWYKWGDAGSLLVAIEGACR